MLQKSLIYIFASTGYNI